MGRSVAKPDLFVQPFTLHRIMQSCLMSEIGINKRAGILVRLWRGEERLWKAYWLIGVLGGWAVQSIVVNLVLFEIVPVIPGVAVSVLYALYAFVTIWRCAFNTARRFWGLLARGLIIVLPLLAIGELFLGGN